MFSFVGNSHVRGTACSCLLATWHRLPHDVDVCHSRSVVCFRFLSFCALTLSVQAMVVVSGGWGGARARLNDTTTTLLDKSFYQDEQLLSEGIPRTPPEQWTTPGECLLIQVSGAVLTRTASEMPSTPHVPLRRSRHLSEDQDGQDEEYLVAQRLSLPREIQNGVRAGYGVSNIDDELSEGSDGANTPATPQLSENDEPDAPFTPRIGQINDEDLIDDESSPFDDQWEEEEDGQSDAEQFSFFDDSYANEEGTSPAEVEHLWNAVVNGDGAFDDTNNSWADIDCGSKSDWDDNASVASYDTLSNWASEPNDPEPDARDDWSVRPKSRRIVEPRKVSADAERNDLFGRADITTQAEPMTPEQSWASATERARRGCQAHGESVEGPCFARLLSTLLWLRD